MVRSRTPRSAVHGHGRRLLLTSARELFGQKGYAGASTREIASRAGVTEPMLFRHFGTKANLFQEAAVNPFVDFMDQYVADYRSRQHGLLSAEEEGRRFFTGFYEALVGQRELLVAFVSTDTDVPELHDMRSQINDAFERVLALFEEVVESEAQVRRFADVDRPAAVRVMVGMALSLALHGAWLRVGDGVSVDRVLAAMTTMAVGGLGVAGEAKPSLP